MKLEAQNFTESYISVCLYEQTKSSSSSCIEVFTKGLFQVKTLLKSTIWPIHKSALMIMQCVDENGKPSFPSQDSASRSTCNKVGGNTLLIVTGLFQNPIISVHSLLLN